MCRADGTELAQAAAEARPPAVKQPPVCPRRLILFNFNLILGLLISQLIPEWLEMETYQRYQHGIRVITMFHLSYIMINVGFEFDIDKRNKRKYAVDYAVSCTAATFPWIAVSLYFMFCLGEHNVPWKMALVAGRFAAPTSAGILFTMLEAAGMKETWLFRKARILAIFDDLDTLLLMVPLKAIVVGARWELSIDLVFVCVCLTCTYVWLHRLHIPTTWYAVMLYAGLVTTLCELVHHFTSSDTVDSADVVETIHLEVLLPAFAIGCVAVHGEHAPQPGRAATKAAPAAGAAAAPAGPERSLSRSLSRAGTVALTQLKKVKHTPQDDVSFLVSAVFMVLVGLSMPSLFKADELSGGHRRLAEDAGSSDDGGGSSGSSGSGGGGAEQMEWGALVGHVVAVSLLMNLGKLFPAFCYRQSVGWRTRLALAIGMMPRGEVGAGIIVNAIALGVNGGAITISVLCFALNTITVSGMIYAVKRLAGTPENLEEQSKHAGINFVAVAIGGGADSVHGGQAFRVQHAASAPPHHAAPLPLSRAADELKAVPKGAATPLDGLSDISAPAAADSNGPSPVISRRPSATAAAAGPPADDDTAIAAWREYLNSDGPPPKP